LAYLDAAGRLGDYDCSKCQGDGDYAKLARKNWGCDEPATAPGSVDCVFCGGVGCSYCDNKGEWVFERCPLRTLKDLDNDQPDLVGWPYRIIREYSRYRNGILPGSAGFQEHPACFVQAVDLLDGITARWQQEEDEKARTEMQKTQQIQAAKRAKPRA